MPPTSATPTDALAREQYDIMLDDIVESGGGGDGAQARSVVTVQPSRTRVGLAEQLSAGGVVVTGSGDPLQCVANHSVADSASVGLITLGVVLTNVTTFAVQNIRYEWHCCVVE